MKATTRLTYSQREEEWKSGRKMKPSKERVARADTCANWARRSGAGRRLPR